MEAINKMWKKACSQNFNLQMYFNYDPRESGKSVNESLNFTSYFRGNIEGKSLFEPYSFPSK